MTMTTEEEQKFILKELEWAKKLLDEKTGELAAAQRRYNEMKFRADITQKALDDFYVAHPDMHPVAEA